MRLSSVSLTALIAALRSAGAEETHLATLDGEVANLKADEAAEPAASTGVSQADFDALKSTVDDHETRLSDIEGAVGQLDPANTGGGQSGGGGGQQAQPKAISPATIPDGVVGQTYDVQLSAGDGASFHNASGALPDGLDMDLTGHVTGTPTAPGVFAFELTAATPAGEAHNTYRESLASAAFAAPIPANTPGYESMDQANGTAPAAQAAGSLPDTTNTGAAVVISQQDQGSALPPRSGTAASDKATAPAEVSSTLGAGSPKQ